MSVDGFLDTNILVYAFDSSNAKKREVARRLIEGKGWWVSWQVVQEFTSVVLHRFSVPLKPKDLGEYLDVAIWPRCRVFPSSEISQEALRLHSATGHRFYDCLILASALASGAKTLFSEDFQHGRKYGSVVVMNPFREN